MADPSPPTSPARNAAQPSLLADVFQSRYREVTVSALVLGVLLGAIMNAAITYAGLKIGFTIGGSAIAAVLGFGVLRGILRKGSIAETNIVQTVASAVNTSNSGIIFTVPALYLMGIEFNVPLMIGASIAGAVLGVAFIIPTRKQMIDIERLRFPSAYAVGAILKSPGAGVAKSVALLAGAAIAMLIYLPVGLATVEVNVPVDELDQLVAEGAITAEQAELSRRVAQWAEQGRAPDDVIRQGAEFHAAIEAGNVKEADVDRLALYAYRAQQGEGMTWDEFTDEFRAKRPLWGYSRLDLRLGDPRPEGSTESLGRYRDRDGDGRPDLVVTDDMIDAGRLLGLPAHLQLVFAIAPFAIGAGFLTGRAGLVVLAGGLLAYYIINPVAYALGWLPVKPDQVPGTALGAFNRHLGIGLLLGGAFMGIIVALPALKAAVAGLRGPSVKGRASEELGLGFLGAAVGLAFLVLLVAAHVAIGQDAAEASNSFALLAPLPRLLQSAVIALIGTAWIWFAGIIIAQCTGMTDWSPISGLALLTVVLILFLGGTGQVVAAVLVGAALCTAITEAADMMGDLKTGFLVGAKPKRQQFVEIFAAALGPAITFATMAMIVANNMESAGVPMGPGTDTVAPQGQALAGVITAVQGGGVVYALYGAGAILGILLGLGSFAGLGVLVGLSMYLPIFYILPYGIGCLINIVTVRLKGRQWAEDWGIPVAAGLIVGEAVLSLGFSLWNVAFS